MQHGYFAASNSAEGFKSYFPAIFSRADQLYVVKGGPGTGKSGFMRKNAACAERRGYEVEYYYCSSDPSSLDGVLIEMKDKRIGILDGTAPHTWELQLPGAADELVDLGRFWNPDVLRGQKNEISALMGKKSAAYKRAYGYLRSCGNLLAVNDSLLRGAVDRDKLRAAAERQARALGLRKGTAVLLPALTDAVAMTGCHHLDSFEKNSEEIFYVTPLYGVGGLYLDALLGVLSGYDATLRVSYDPVDPKRVSGIYIEERKIAFLLAGTERDEEDRVINSRRFARQNLLRDARGELRYASRLYRECLDGALHALSEAKVYHFLLEDLYKNAMDFAALTRFTEAFAEEVWG